MQDQTYKSVLLKILEAIDYEDDKEAFADKFIGMTQMQAVSDLMQTLPQEQQESMKSELEKEPNNPEKVTGIIKSHFSEEQLQKTLEAAVTNGITNWMKAVEPTLSDAQKQKLGALSQEFQQNLPSPSV